MFAAGLGLVPQADELVVGQHHEEQEHDDEADDDPRPEHDEGDTRHGGGRRHGRGARDALRPLTERYAKPVLPIDGRPVIVTLLHELAFAERVVVVVRHLGHQVRALWTRSRRICGSSSNLRRSGRATRSQGRGDAALVLAADTAFRPGDVRRFAGPRRTARSRCERGRTESGPPARRGGGRRPGRPLRRRVERVVWCAALARARWIHGRVRERPGSPPWELGTSFQLAVDAGLDWCSRDRPDPRFDASA